MRASTLPSLLPASPTADPARLLAAISRLAVAYSELELRAAAAADEASELRRERDSAVSKLRDATEAWGLAQHALRALEAGAIAEASLDALRGAALTEAAHTIRLLTDKAAEAAAAAMRASLDVEAPRVALECEVSRLSRELLASLTLHAARERTFHEAAARAEAAAAGAIELARAAEARAAEAEALRAACEGAAATVAADNVRLRAELDNAQATAAHAARLAAEVLTLRDELRIARD